MIIVEKTTVEHRLEQVLGIRPRHEQYDISIDDVFAAIGAPVVMVRDYEASTDDVDLAVRCELFRHWTPTDTLLVLSYLRRGFTAFRLPASELRAFVSSFCGQFGESFFNGDDVVVVSESSDSVWAFHHEGAWTRRHAPERS